ncbi:MAG: 2-oxo acid dehydrogenase subunit E2 [Candidatus Omnitrophica bacterium]|nr:2-oxo acid dehydrogenase subunit E2 [Candidatus Omnitrophota bacterium]
MRVPHLGEGADSGSVVSVLVKEGDRISKDQTLIELENEKAVAPIPSSHAGVVKKIYVKAGDKVTVGQAILSLETSGSEEAFPSTPTKIASPRHPAELAMTGGGVGDFVYHSSSGAPPPASPTVRRLAKDLGIDLAKVKGSEAGGRIVLSDLKAYVRRLRDLAESAKTPSPSAAGKAPSEKVDFSKWGKISVRPSSSLRRKIGQRMTESWTTVPHVTQFDEADITSLMALRKKNAGAFEKKGAKLTLTPFVMKAVVAALKKYPAANASLDEETQEIIFKEYIHLGVAVDTESGLIVPVVRDADKKSLLQIAQELEGLAEKTRQRKISLEELKGGSFTISNLGSIGGGPFTPIINKPEVAILGVGRGALRPVVVSAAGQEKIESRLMLPLALSYDHRVLDGADGARFIREVAHNLENFKEKDVK